MAALTGNQIILDGTYDVPVIPGRKYSVMAAGTFGGGTLSFSTVDSSSGNAVALPTYGTATADTVFEFTAPADVFQVSLAGATSPAITLIVTLCAS